MGKVPIILKKGLGSVLAQPVPEVRVWPPTPKPVWKEEEVTLAIINGDTKKKVKDVTIRASLLGRFAVHESLKEYPYGKVKWSVSLIPEGLRILDVNTLEDATKITEELWKRCRNRFLNGTPEYIRSNLPGWVHPWLKGCDKLGAYLSPEYFLQENLRVGGRT